MNASGIRLLVLDVDGTLLDSRHELTAGNRAAVRAAAAAGIEVALATGRRYSFALPVAEALGCAPVIIASNGALVRRAHGAVLASRLLPRADARAALAILAAWRRQAVLTFPVEGVGELCMESAEEARRAFPGWLERNLADMRFCRPLEDALDTDPVQVMFGGRMAEMATAFTALRAAELSARLHVTRTVYPERDLAIVDVLPAGATKGAAVARLAAELGIAATEVMAIGDNHNDLEMLEFAGRAVLMGNAPRELDRPGWHRTLDQDHDGVAAALAALAHGGAQSP